MGEVETRAGGLPPIKVFLILAALLAAGVTAYVLTRDPTSVPKKAASDESADTFFVSQLGHLEQIHYIAYENRDLSLIPDFAAASSKYQEVVQGEIDRLLADGVTVDIDYRILAAELIEKSSTSVVLEGQVRTDAAFFDESGEELTKRRQPEIQTIRWTLSLTPDGWRIEEARITEVES